MVDLSTLKNEVLDELINITDSEGLDPVEKFELIMTRYVNTGDTALLGAAFKAAKKIEDVSYRGTALMQLLEEIELSQAEIVAQDDITEADTPPSNKDHQ